MNKKLNRKIGALIATIVVISLIAAIAPTVSAVPVNVTYNEGETGTYNATSSAYDNATGGYISEANLTSYSTTTKWQGYYGNLEGYILLADSSGHEMFNWVANISKGGEVFAVARAAVPTFTVVDTLDITAADADSALTNDSTWSEAGSDSVNVTFSADNDNSVLYVAGQTVTAGTRNRMYTLDSSGNSAFAEVLLTDQSSVNTVDDMIWTSLIVDNSENYKGTTSDFQMIVPTTDSGDATTTYYFYVELS
jgi:hypothetical protein